MSRQHHYLIIKTEANQNYELCPQLSRDAELVRPERCKGCGDYSFQISITPSCRRVACPRELDSERVRYSMQNIVLADGFIDDMERRPPVLDRLKKIFRRRERE